MHQPLITAVIPCYNQAQFAYESIVSAKFSYSGPTEIIVVDDGSTDPSVSVVLRELAREHSDGRCEIRIIHQSNAGLPGARNRGISEARGTFIQLLDCDDLLVKGKIDLQLKHLRSAAYADVSVTGSLYANEQLDHFENLSGHTCDYDFSLYDFLFNWERGFSIPIHAALFKRHVFSTIMFDTAVKAKEDWVFWSNVAAYGYRIAFLHTSAAVYRIHESSMCRSMTEMGTQWLRAAKAIEPLAMKEFPTFMSAAIQWKNRVYAEPEEASHGTPAGGGATQFNEQTITSTISSPAWTKSYSNDRPAISVIIPVHNHFKFLQRCLDSLIEQEFQDFEVIATDDCSTDGRVRSLLQQYAESGLGRFRAFYNQENLGIARTQNQAVQRARGEYIAFLDCDDYLPPNALSKAIGHISQNGGCDYFFSDRIDVDSDNRELRHARYGGYSDRVFSGDIRTDLIKGMVASHLKIIRRSAFLAAGGFDPKFSGVQDWELALKMRDCRFLYYSEPLYFHRIHSQARTAASIRSQYYLTNIVRRRYGEAAATRSVQSSSQLVLNETDLADLDRIVEAWKCSLLSLDFTGNVSSEQLWKAREFNSFFEETWWSSSEVYASLIGFVWAPEMLRRN